MELSRWIFIVVFVLLAAGSFMRFLLPSEKIDVRASITTRMLKKGRSIEYIVEETGIEKNYVEAVAKTVHQEIALHVLESKQNDIFKTLEKIRSDLVVLGEKIRTREEVKE